MLANYPGLGIVHPIMTGITILAKWAIQYSSKFVSEACQNFFKSLLTMFIQPSRISENNTKSNIKRKVCTEVGVGPQENLDII